MKKSLLYLLLALPLCFTSCSDEDDPVDITVHLNQTQLNYDSEGVWDGVSSAAPFESHNLVFSHQGEIGQWGLLWSGFTPARVSSTEHQSDWLSHQFQIMTGGGMDGLGTPYIVAFWNTQETEATPLDERSCLITYRANLNAGKQPFTPLSVYVQNTAYAYYTMTEGNAFSAPLADDGFLTLIAHGVRADNTESTAEFPLADHGKYAVDWTKFDLTPLGEVTAIYFTIEGSDTGQWGLNTPSYFALDRLCVRAGLL